MRAKLDQQARLQRLHEPPGERHVAVPGAVDAEAAGTREERLERRRQQGLQADLRHGCELCRLGHSVVQLLLSRVEPAAPIEHRKAAGNTCASKRVALALRLL